MIFQDDTFYDIFRFSNIELRAIDKGICFEDCIILKDLTFSTEKLTKGYCYFTIYFYWKEQEFHFINWDTSDESNWIPKEKLIISQNELVKQMNWDPI